MGMICHREVERSIVTSFYLKEDCGCPEEFDTVHLVGYVKVLGWEGCLETPHIQYCFIVPSYGEFEGGSFWLLKKEIYRKNSDLFWDYSLKCIKFIWRAKNRTADTKHRKSNFILFTHIMENFAVDISSYKKTKFDRGIPEIFGHTCWKIDKTPTTTPRKKSCRISILTTPMFWKVSSVG